jgi:hypothetical protein
MAIGDWRSRRNWHRGVLHLNRMRGSYDPSTRRQEAEAAYRLLSLATGGARASPSESSPAVSARSRSPRPVWAGLADAALESGRLEEAALYADRALRTGYAPETRTAHSVLGRLAIRNGDLMTAEAELGRMAAEPTQVGEKMTSPNTTLAQELLSAGCTRAVLAFLTSLETEGVISSDVLRAWSDAIQRGEKPELRVKVTATKIFAVAIREGASGSGTRSNGGKQK